MADNFVMDNPSTSNDSNINHEHHTDDLTEIVGIGTAKQRWLQTELGIYTFQDLAIASASEIEAHLRADRCFISQREIEQWIAQAQERITNSTLLILPGTVREHDASQLLDATVASESDSKPVELLQNTVPLTVELAAEQEEAISTDSEMATSQSLNSENNLETDPEDNDENHVSHVITTSVSKNEWQTIASFTIQHQVKRVNGVIEQRTLAQHHETNQSVTWTISAEPFQDVQQWMISHIPSIVQPVSQIQPSTNQPAIATVIEGLQILQGSQQQALVTWQQDHIHSPLLVRRGEPFILKISFNFVGVPSGVHTQGSYILQIYAQHRALGTTLELGHHKAEVVLNGQSSYVAYLPDATLERTGIYCVQVLLTLEDLPVAPGYLEMPMLQVI